MLYGEELHIVEAANSDSGTMTAVNLTSALGTDNLVKTMLLPGVVKSFGFRCVTVFTLGSTPTPAVFTLYKRPFSMVADDLATGIEAYNALTVAMNAHAADEVMHAVADTVYFSSVLTPTTPVTGLADLIAGVNLIETAYIGHNATAAAGTGAHAGGAGTTHTLASAATATTLATALTQLNDIIIKYNLHDEILTAHAVANRHPAIQVPLGTITLAAGYLPGKVYSVDVPNTVVDEVPVKPGKALYNVGDQLAIVTTTLAIGGTKAGTLQPFVVVSNRGESRANMEQLVDLTAAIVGI